MYMTNSSVVELQTEVCCSMLFHLQQAVNSVPGPFLRVREEFHPKRNRVRQKLATLPTSRCEDLTGDVYSELVRRYPEFTEAGGVASDNSAIGDGFGDAWADLRVRLFHTFLAHNSLTFRNTWKRWQNRSSTHFKMYYQAQRLRQL